MNAAGAEIEEKDEATGRNVSHSGESHMMTPNLITSG
jgi:hypothetical protein